MLSIPVTPNILKNYFKKNRHYETKNPMKKNANKNIVAV